jgi:hypothetical protein
MKNIPEGLIEFKTFEKRIFTTMCRAGCELIGEYLREWDRQILTQRDAKEYRIVNFGTTTIKTLMGEVPYTRRYYKKRSGGYVFLLDKAIGVTANYGLVSENLAEQIVAECAEKSFHKAAVSISELTGQTISAMGAWDVFQRFGKLLGKQEERLKELDDQGVDGQLGKIGSPVLFSEFDDVWLSMQKETRRRQCESGNPKGKKAGKKPIHMGTAYTGWSLGECGRYRTEDKIAYASFGDPKEFNATFEVFLRHRYDMDGVQRRVTNGDGANWIKTAADNNEAVLQLDPYHRSQAIIKAISSKTDRKAVFEAIRDRNAEKALNTVNDLITKAEDDSSLDKLRKLFSYFHQNKDNLLTWRERGIELPPPPEGIYYRNLGLQESSNCNLVTHRMKHRKGSWTPTGGNHMAKILCLRNTIGLDTMLGWLPEPVAAETSAETLSAAKTPLYDGKGNDGEWLHAEMPYEQAFKTNGREAIRRLLSQRSLFNLAYL